LAAVTIEFLQLSKVLRIYRFKTMVRKNSTALSHRFNFIPLRVKGIFS
jgi:hypothetical protein